MRHALLLAAALLTCPAAAPAQHDLLVSGYASQAIHRYDAAGAPLGSVAAAPGAQSLRYGPDGALYACAEDQDRVLRLDGTTGALLAPFVWDDPATPGDETGGLDAPTAAVFGPDGALYVASFSQSRVLRYDGLTGAYLGDFIAAGAPLNGPDAGMCFGPDGHLYVPSFNNNRVLRYDGQTGALLDTFVTQIEGLSRPRMLRFRGDGSLWVTSWGNNRLLRFDLQGVLAQSVTAGVPRPTGLAIDPADGSLLVASDQGNDVRRVHGTSGAPLGTVVAAGAGGLVGATFVELLPQGDLRLARLLPGLAGAPGLLELRGGTPGGTAFLLCGFAPLAAPLGPCGAWIGVDFVLALALPLDAAGDFVLGLPLPPALSGLTLHLQAYDPASCRSSNLVIQAFA